MASKMQLMYLVARLCSDPLEELTTRTETALRKRVIKMLHVRLVQVCTTVTDLQMLRCDFARLLNYTRLRGYKCLELFASCRRLFIIV